MKYMQEEAIRVVNTLTDLRGGRGKEWMCFITLKACDLFRFQFKRNQLMGIKG